MKAINSYAIKSYLNVFSILFLLSFIKISNSKSYLDKIYILQNFKVQKIQLKSAKIKANIDRYNEDMENQMLTLMNKQRISRKLRALDSDTLLRFVARLHSKDMAENGFFAHINLKGKSPFDRLQDYGIVNSYMGENLAYADNVLIAFNDLMNS